MTAQKRHNKGVLSRIFSEKRLYIQSGQNTSYLKASPAQQLAVAVLSVVIVGWLSTSTAIVVLDRVSAHAPASDQDVLQVAYQGRLEELATERDQRAHEASSARQRFQIATEEMSRQQNDILASVEENRELSIALEALRTRYQETKNSLDTVAELNEELKDRLETPDNVANISGDLADTELEDILQTVSGALTDAAQARDTATAAQSELEIKLAEIELRELVNSKRQDEMVDQLEQAVAMSFGPLEKMMKTSNINVDEVLKTVRRTHSGAGGPLIPASVSSRSFQDSDVSGRFDEVMLELDRMNLLRIAAGKIPYALPVKSTFRFTSGYGYRRDPKGAGRRMHKGIDLASSRGTPIYATADGVVTSAKHEGGYGRTVRIQHEFGFETVYAHQTKLYVKAGQRVSRGDHIGDMGTTGRSTGVHLHYEVHLNGRAVNPMTYLEAAKDVF